MAESGFPFNVSNNWELDYVLKEKEVDDLDKTQIKSGMKT